MVNIDSKYGIVLNRITLNFSDLTMEKEFRQNYFIKSLFVVRVAVITSIVLYACFGLLDKLASPTYSNEFLFIRFYIVVPALLVFIGLTFLKSFRRYWQPIMSFFLIISGSGIIYMLHRNPENLYYYGGLFLIFMGGYFFLKIRFFSAALTGLILVCIYNVAYFFIPLNGASSVDNLIVANAFFLSSNIICMIGLYNIEKLERIDFYQQKLLSNKQVEIENINTDLENKVKERTQDLMLSKDKAEESERLKSAFLANMSHEIRTPMNGILGFSDLLKDPRLTGEEQLHFISIIEKSGARMLSTVNDIVEISKIESGQMEVSLGTIDAADEIKSLYEFFKPEAEAKGIDLSLRMDETKLNWRLVTDHTKFSSILSNLIKNAIKYTDEGSVKISCSVKEDFMVYSVRDTGIGIPIDRIDAIFNRFEQADITDRHARQGSGLGLAITKSYVEMLGGKIWVERIEENELKGKSSGSVFNLTLPLIRDYDEVASPNKNMEIKSINEKKYTILIVEDDEVSAQYLSVLVKGVAAKLLFARTGREAVECVKKSANIDLVLMDVKMPEMNGYEATELIKEHNRDLPIVMITAYAYSEDKKKAKEAGCDGFVAKPVEKNKLFELLEKVLITKLTK